MNKLPINKLHIGHGSVQLVIHIGYINEYDIFYNH